MNDATLQWFFEQTENEEKDRFDRVKFYKEYYENISPDSFNVSIDKDDNIVIRVTN